MEKKHYETINREQFEKAIYFVVENFKNTTEFSKPVLFHSIHTGMILYDSGYSKNIVLGGLMHDLIEDTSTTKEEIEKIYGIEVAKIVNANTKDKNIQDKAERKLAMIQNCIEAGEDALIVKAADIIENYTYHPTIGWNEGVKYLNDCSKLIFDLKPNDYNDPIFEKLAKINRDNLSK